MSALHAIILGVVQGLTEFLPISSSGHLVVFQQLLGLMEPGIAFEVSVHVGTLAAVVIFFRQEILEVNNAAVSGIRSIAADRGEFSRLYAEDTGFHRVSGRVEHVTETGKGIWLFMSELMMSIRREDMTYFDPTELRAYINRLQSEFRNFTGPRGDFNFVLCQRFERVTLFLNPW